MNHTPANATAATRNQRTSVAGRQGGVRGRTPGASDGVAAATQQGHGPQHGPREECEAGEDVARQVPHHLMIHGA